MSDVMTIKMSVTRKPNLFFYRLGFEIFMVAGAGFEPTTFGL